MDAVEVLIQNYANLESRVISLHDSLKLIDSKRNDEIIEKSNIKEKLNTLLQLLPVGVVVINDKGVVIQYNPKAKSILGCDIENKSWQQVIDDVYCPQLDDGLEITLKNNRKISIATSSLGEDLGQLILLNDMTYTRALQADLSREQRLACLGKMMAAVAHQIKTPLASALLYASHLDRKNLDKKLQKKFSRNILESLKFLNQLVDSMLLFARGELPSFDKITVDDILKEINRTIKDYIMQNQISLNVKVEEGINNCVFMSNKKALATAVMNLIVNGVEASGTNASIDLNISSEKDYISISVKDKGHGIEDEVMPHVLDEFFTTKATGTGLGLAVVKIITDACNGKLELQSSRMQGPLVTIKLPEVKSE